MKKCKVPFVGGRVKIKYNKPDARVGAPSKVLKPIYELTGCGCSDRSARKMTDHGCTRGGASEVSR